MSSSPVLWAIRNVIKKRFGGNEQAIDTLSNRRDAASKGRKTESKTPYCKSSRKRLFIKILREEERQRCKFAVGVYDDGIGQKFAATR